MEKEEHIKAAESLGCELRRCGFTVSTAESCTAGGIGKRIASVAGSSDYFVGGVISYSAAIKQRVLGVRTDTIGRFGVVSKETVTEMALGVSRLMLTDCSLSVSGVAGPGRSDNDPDVGTIWIGVCVRGDVETVKIEHDFGSRAANIEHAISVAVDALTERLRRLG